MPGFDGTGPLGEGSFTGRGEGFCAMKLSDIKDPRVRQALVGHIEQAKEKQDREEVIAMPGGDGTGPMGMGPMTGRVAGYCAGYGVPGFMNTTPGRGGWGRGGGGWGRRNRFYATGLTGWQRAAMGGPSFAGPGPYAAPFTPTVTREQELDLLKGQAGYFEDALDGIKKRLEELEAKTEK